MINLYIYGYVSGGVCIRLRLRVVPERGLYKKKTVLLQSPTRGPFIEFSENDIISLCVYTLHITRVKERRRANYVIHDPYKCTTNRLTVYSVSELKYRSK